LLSEFDEDLLVDVGWSGEEIDEIFGLERAEDYDAEKEFQKVVKNPRGVKAGDLWQVGNHKLIIGDCVDRKNWERLLGKERFDYLLTDPPYQLGVGTKQGTRLKEKGFGYKGNRFYLGTKQLGRVPEYDEWLSKANNFQNPGGANVMIFENWKNTVKLWQAIGKYWKIRNMIIWWLPNRHQGFSAPYRFFSKYDIAPLAGEGKLNEEYEKELEDYLNEKGQKLLDSYEIILYGGRGESYWDIKKGTRWAGISDHITWTAETEKSSGQSVIFGTKPIPILVPYIKILSPRNGIVVDPFVGSGSTIIASEIMKRKARCIEFSPIYGEVILNRVEKFIDEKAKKIN